MSKEELDEAGTLYCGNVYSNGLECWLCFKGSVRAKCPTGGARRSSRSSTLCRSDLDSGPLGVARYLGVDSWSLAESIERKSVGTGLLARDTTRLAVGGRTLGASVTDKEQTR